MVEEDFHVGETDVDGAPLPSNPESAAAGVRSSGSRGNVLMGSEEAAAMPMLLVSRFALTARATCCLTTLYAA
eukprot:COSAG05_NODE_379_length_10567_cov_18.553687_13_plen_73_part_00